MSQIVCSTFFQRGLVRHSIAGATFTFSWVASCVAISPAITFCGLCFCYLIRDNLIEISPAVTRLTSIAVFLSEHILNKIELAISFDFHFMLLYVVLGGD